MGERGIFICYEPQQGVCNQIHISNPDAKIYCLYGPFWTMTIEAGWAECIDVRGLMARPDISGKYMTNALLQIEAFVRSRGIEEFFYVGATTRVFFSANTMLLLLRGTYTGFAAPYQGHRSLSLSLFYVKTREDFSDFVSWMSLSSFKEYKLAFTYVRIYRPHKTDFLPTLKNAELEKDAEYFTSQADVFSGVWDNGSYAGRIISGKTTEMFALREFDYHWGKNEDGRMYPYIYLQNQRVPLYTLVL